MVLEKQKEFESNGLIHNILTLLKLGFCLTWHIY